MLILNIVSEKYLNFYQKYWLFQKKSAILVLLLQNSGQISPKLVQKADFYPFLILTGQNWSISSGLNRLKPGG